MNALLDVFSQNSGVLTAIATLVIAVSAVFTAILTRSLARENQLLRKAGTEPKVVAYLTPELGSYVAHVNLVVANIGQGPAQNVSYRIVAKEEDFKRYNIPFLKHDAQPMIAFLPQGERIRALLVTHELFGRGAGEDKPNDSPMPPFDVTVDYENLKGKALAGTFRLDVSHFANMGGPVVAPEHVVAEALKKIERHVEKFTRDRRPQ